MIPCLMVLVAIMAADDIDFSKSDGLVLSLLSNKKVISELELTPEQLQWVKETKRSSGPRISALFRQMVPVDEAGRQLRADAVRQQRTEIDRDATTILSRTQATRLHQLVVQYRTRQERFSFGLLNDEIAKHLQLTESQRQQLGAEAKRFEEEHKIQLAMLREKIVKLEADCREELFTKLSPAQRVEYDEVFGEPFYFPTEDRGFAQFQLLLFNMRQR